MKIVVSFLVVVILAMLAYVRYAPSDARAWHVDPLTAKKPKLPNAFLFRGAGGKHPAPEYEMPAGALAVKFDDLAMLKPSVTRLDGDPADLFVTYIARTKYVGFPDYISIKFIELDADRSTIAVFSRSRFGYSDRGVNRRRVLAWLAELERG